MKNSAVCKKCKTTRPSLSWTTTDLAAMAKQVDFAANYPNLAYFPTLHIHTTGACHHDAPRTPRRRRYRFQIGAAAQQGRCRVKRCALVSHRNARRTD